MFEHNPVNFFCSIFRYGGIVRIVYHSLLSHITRIINLTTVILMNINNNY